MPEKKRKLNGSETSSTCPPTPTSPAASAPGTPVAEQQQQPQQPASKKRRTPKAEEPVTPLSKGREMGSKLLKKKSDAANLALTLQAVPYAEQLCTEMTAFAKQFESLSCIGFACVTSEIYMQKYICKIVVESIYIEYTSL